MKLLKRLFARRTPTPVVQEPVEQSPYAPVWTTGAAPEDEPMRTSTVADDEAILRMLAGANFGPNASVILPTGRRLGGDEAQALTSFYAPDAEEDR